MRIGEFQELVAVKETPHGYYLGDEESTVLLPRKECPPGLRYGHRLNAFIYTDSEDRPVATLRKPLATVGDFAAMRVASITRAGAFLDWGLDKDLFCPIREQPFPMRSGETHLVRVYLDEVSNRVAASARLGRFLPSGGADFTVGQRVEVMITGRSPDAFSAIVDGVARGFLYNDEQVDSLSIGEKRTAYIKQIRPRDHKIALSLRPQGFAGILGERERILTALEENGGALPYSDRSSPAEIQRVFGLSKASFKKLIGTLYREGKIQVEEDGIRLVQS